MTNTTESTFYSEYDDYDALGLAALVKTRQVAPGELVEIAIERAEQLNPVLNAVTIKTYEQAREDAKNVALTGPFAGVPFLAKDLVTTWKDVLSTSSCRYFEGFKPDHDSEIVRRTRRAGFLLIGKTNAPEFGWCLSTEPPMYGPTNNPWQEGVVAGGSSGGSAAAVASGIVPLADASDGAGSIRVPAAVNGVVGLKPTRGRMTLMPDAADFWHGGAIFFCLSRTIRDSAAMLDVLQGAAPGDPYNTPPPVRPYSCEPGADPRGLRIGFSTRNPRGDKNDPEIDSSVLSTARLCEELGHYVDEFDFAYDFEPYWDAYTRIISVASASFFDAMESVIGRPVQEDDLTTTIWTSVVRGREQTAVEHAADIETVRLGSRAIASHLARFDAVVMPVLPQKTRPMGFYDMSLDISTYNDEVMGIDEPYLFPFNISGQPAMSLPLGQDANGLPIGVQFVARPGDEATLFQLAGQLEIAAPWHRRMPELREQSKLRGQQLSL